MNLVEENRNKKRFISIHNHSEFSLLDGGARIKDIIDHAKAMGQDSIAITDHGTMHGIVRAFKYAKEVGIKLLVGCELYLTPYGKLMKDKEFKKGERSAYHLIVIAKNKEGYKNLCNLCSIAWAEGFYRRPRIDRESLAKYSEGLIVTSACMAGPISQAILAGDEQQAINEIEFFKRTFGEDFYIEIQNHKIPEERMAMEESRKLAEKMGVEMVIGTDAHYLLETDEDVHDALICIGTGQKVDGERRFKFNGSGYHYMSEQEVIKLFPDDIEAIYNTGVIADKCDDEIIETGKLHLPYFNIPKDKEFEQWEGADKWLIQIKKDI